MRSPSHLPATRLEVESVLRCEVRGRSPLFLPAIYEHKAWFIGQTPSAISRDVDLLVRALLAEHAALRPDALVIGVDVYNVEAEAVGCPVKFFEGDDPSIPGIQPGSHILQAGDDLAHAALPNPLSAGRMPVNLAAAREVRRALGDDFWLRGAVTGPFSLAVSLVGAEELFMACLDQPEWVRGLLAYAGRITREFAQAYIDAGVELIVFDSQASPDLLSPAMYEAFVLPVTRDLIRWANTQGVRDVPLIIGGNTTAIAEQLVRTGANNLLCDFTADFDAWSGVARKYGRALRRNLALRLIQTGTPDQNYRAAVQELQRGRALPGFIMGTAVVPFGSPTENILAIKQACLDAALPLSGQEPT